MFAHTTSGANRGNTWKRERTVRGEEWGGERETKKTNRKTERQRRDERSSDFQA